MSAKNGPKGARWDDSRYVIYNEQVRVSPKTKSPPQHRGLLYLILNILPILITNYLLIIFNLIRQFNGKFQNFIIIQNLARTAVNADKFFRI